MKETVREWCDEVRLLAQIAKSEPQAAYTAFVGGYKHKLTYKIRTIDGLENHLQQLDHVIDSVFIPAISEGHQCTKDERLLLSLPSNMGGLAVPIFTNLASQEYAN